MKKIVIGIIFGIALGALGAWLVSARTSPAEAANKSEPVAAKPAEAPNPLQLNAAKRAANEIELGTATESEVEPDIEVFGRVIDATGFITAIADVDAARAALTASEKEFDRVKQLFAAEGNASAQALDTAQAARTRDQAALDAASAKLISGWVHTTQNPPDFDGVLDALKKGAVIARIDFLPGQTMATGVDHVQISLVGSTDVADGEILGLAAVSDIQLQGPGYWVLVRDHPFPAGAPLRARVRTTGEAKKILAVPRSAIVYHEGSAWIYVLGEEDTFARKLVQVGPEVRGGVSVTGIESGDQIVVKGAQQLLSAELQAGGAKDED